MGKEIGRSFKYNRSKIFTTTLKKPVLSSSAAHASSASNSKPYFDLLSFLNCPHFHIFGL